MQKYCKHNIPIGNHPFIFLHFTDKKAAIFSVINSGNLLLRFFGMEWMKGVHALKVAQLDALGIHVLWYEWSVFQF